MRGKMRMLRGSARLSRRPDSTNYCGRTLGCFSGDHHGLASLDEVGLDNICREIDRPHTHTTRPHSGLLSRLF